MYKDLEAAKKGLQGYVNMKEIKAGPEPAYHVVRANQTLNPKLQVLDDENYMISSEAYVNQLKAYWEGENPKRAEKGLPPVEVQVLDTANVIKDATN